MLSLTNSHLMDFSNQSLLVQCTLVYLFSYLFIIHSWFLYFFYTRKYDWNELGSDTPFSRSFWLVYITDHLVIEIIMSYHYIIIAQESISSPNYALNVSTAILVGSYINIPLGYGFQLLYYPQSNLKMPILEKIIWMFLFGFYALVFSPWNPIPFLFSYALLIQILMQLMIWIVFILLAVLTACCKITL